MTKVTVKKIFIGFITLLLCFLGGFLLLMILNKDSNLSADKPIIKQETNQKTRQDFPQQIQQEINQRIQEISPQTQQGNIIFDDSRIALHINRVLEESITVLCDEGLVPDAETAIKIAEAVWLPIYGEKIYKQQPFIAEYYPKQDCWFVHGTLPTGFIGGTAEMILRKSDGKILSVTHGK